jgi:hypothetical protein
MTFVYLLYLLSYVVSGEKEEEEELTVTGTAPTSTSNTVILSEENLAAVDSSPPPQQIVNTSTPPPSPRAPSPKRQKVGTGDERALLLGSSSTSLVNDVSISCTLFFCILLCFSLFIPIFLTLLIFDCTFPDFSSFHLFFDSL